MFHLYKNIFFYEKKESACNYHRVRLPMAHLSDEFSAKVPIVFFNRTCNLPHAEVAKMKANGYRVVLDLDDDIVLDQGHILHDHYKAARMTEHLVEIAKLADVVLVTNSFLADRIRPYNRNIVVVPNALPFDSGQFVRTQPDGGRAIVYVGGSTHAQDLELIYPSVPRNQFVIAGYFYVDDNDPGSRAWKSIKSLFKFAEFKPLMAVERYMSLYDGKQISVGPLVDNSFNRCRSNLKALEAGAKGLAFVASRVHPYYNGLDQEAVLYANTATEWRRILMKLLTDDGYRRERADLLAAHVREHYDLRRVNRLREQVFQSFS